MDRGSACARRTTGGERRTGHRIGLGSLDVQDARVSSREELPDARPTRGSAARELTRLCAPPTELARRGCSSLGAPQRAEASGSNTPSAAPSRARASRQPGRACPRLRSTPASVDGSSRRGWMRGPPESLAVAPPWCKRARLRVPAVRRGVRDGTPTPTSAPKPLPRPRRRSGWRTQGAKIQVLPSTGGASEGFCSSRS